MKSLLRLGKFTISLPVALTGFLGYFIYSPEFSSPLWLTVAGVFLLSMSSSALNQVVERKTDALMQRTRGRPLPSGELSLGSAIWFVVLAALCGTVLLLRTGSWLPAAIGLFTMAWYILVYTPLKRVTAFAVLPGALTGALPPLIGWTAAGGSPLEREILMVAFFLFVGQMPHYWLLLIRYGKEFQEAGLPSVTSVFDARQIRNLSFVWIAATGVIVLMLPLSPLVENNLLGGFLVLATLAYLVLMYILSFRRKLMSHWKKAFIGVNLFYLVIILVLIGDKLITIIV